jgi:hypothetical protein
MKTTVNIEVLATYALPVDFSREIGRIVVRHAFYEHLLQRIIWKLLRLSQAEGRLAVREPRTVDRLDLIRDLAKLRKTPIDLALYSSMRSRSETLKSERDLLAHGSWGYVELDNSWNVQLVRGAWDNNAANAPEGSRNIEPELLGRNITQLRTTTSQLESIIEDAKTIAKQIMPDLPPWPGTRLAQRAPKSPTPNPDGKGHQPRRRPSRASAPKKKKQSAQQRRREALGRASRRETH